jgi:hypothetical protein
VLPAEFCVFGPVRGPFRHQGPYRDVTGNSCIITVFDVIAMCNLIGVRLRLVQYLLVSP